MTDNGSWQSIEDFEVFKQLEQVSDQVWEVVAGWGSLPRDTVGRQLVRACDSIGANLVEGDGRCHHKETLNFFYIARGSAKETRYWLKRARARRLISQEDADRLDLQIERIRRWINAMIGERRRWLGQVKEDRVEYLADELT